MDSEMRTNRSRNEVVSLRLCNLDSAPSNYAVIGSMHFNRLTLAKSLNRYFKQSVRSALYGISLQNGGLCFVHSTTQSLFISLISCSEISVRFDIPTNVL